VEQVGRRWAKNVRYNRSKSGWFDAVTFADWFESSFIPHARRICDRVVLIGDNLASHFSDRVIQAAKDNNVAFVCCLPKNSTHLCQDTSVAVDFADINLPCEWKQWQTVKEKREIKKGGKTEEKEVAMTLKVTQSGTMGDMNDIFQTQINKFRTHIFNIRHQFKQYQLLRTAMSCNEALVHIDCAENYVAKVSSAMGKDSRPVNRWRWCTVSVNKRLRPRHAAVYIVRTGT